MAKEETSNKKVSRIKVQKKLWYKIISPKFFGEKELGETYLTSPDAAIGRIVKINLKDLTGNIKDQNAYISFRIIGAEGMTLKTKAMGYELTPSSVKRMVRKNADRMDDFYTFATKDGQKVILKSLMVTFHLTHRALQSKMRKELGDSLRQEVRKFDFDTFLSNVALYKIQSPLKKKLSKLYPLKELAIRVLSIRENEEAPIIAEMPEVVPEPVAEESDSEAEEQYKEQAEELTE